MNFDHRKIINNRAYYKNRLEIVLSYLNLEGSSISDLGCGEMILNDLVKGKIKSYLGIDQFPFSNKGQFITGDICDKSLWKNISADFIFLLGVLDHLSPDEKMNVLQFSKINFNKSIIISQRNPKSIINFFHQTKSPVIDLEDFYKNCELKKLYLLKLPFTKIVFDLTGQLDWIKRWNTEMIYIIHKA